MRWLFTGLFSVAAYLGCGISCLAQAGTSTDLRKELGIPTNDILRHQNEQAFLRMLHIDSTWVISKLPHKDQVPVLLEELSSFSTQQEREVKLRFRILIFWLKGNLEQSDDVLFQELLAETTGPEQIALRVNLILIQSFLTQTGSPDLLIKKFWLLHEAVDLLEVNPNADITNREMVMGSIGSIFYQLGDMQNALKHLKRSIIHASGHLLLVNLNNIGYVYRKMKNLDSSEHYFERTLDYAIKTKDTAHIGLGSGNLGENYYLRKRYDKAIPLLETDARFALARNDIGVAANAQLLISEMYLRMGDLEKAGIYLNLGRTNALGSGQYHRFPLLYSISALYYTWMGQTEKAISAQDSLKLVSDSIAGNAASIQSINPELVYQDRKTKELAFQLKIENDARMQKRNMTVLVLFVVISIGGLAFWIYRLKAQLRLNFLLQDKQNLQLSIAESMDALNRMAKNLTESNRQLNQLKESKSEMAGQELRAIERITDSQWADFRTLFEQAHPDFLSRLKALFPNLTPSEIRFTMLVRMQVKDAQMAEMQGVGQEAIRKTRSRLRQKIALQEGQSLEDIILSI